MARINRTQGISDMTTSHTQHLSLSDEAIVTLRDVVSSYAGESISHRPVRVSRCDSTHGVWIVAFGDVKLVYKQLITHQAQAFSHASTFELQRTLYQKGLAAEPLYFDAHKGIWIEAYLPAEEGMLSTGDANQNSTLQNTTRQNCDTDKSDTDNSLRQNTQPLTHALVNLHQARAVDYADDATGKCGESDECGNGDIRRLDPFDHAEYLLAQIETPQAKGIAKTLNLLRAEVQSTTDQNESWVLCHNDMHVAHVRSAQRCIDWEYAAIGPRYFDVAMCITINQICHSSQHAFINAYAQLIDTNPAYAQQQVACYLRLCAIINEIWEQVLHQKG